MARVALASTTGGLLIDQYGRPLVGRNAYVYQTGTTTQVPVYSARVGGSVMGQPLTTNASGYLPGWVAEEQTIDVADPATGNVMTTEVVSGPGVPILGSDGTVGGPGGSQLTPSVANAISLAGTAVQSGDAPISSGASPANPADKARNQVGYYTPDAPGALWTSAACVANQAHSGRFVPTSTITVTKITFVVTVAASVDDPVDVGIYDATGSRLSALGATTGLLNSTGVKTVTLPTPVTLQSGVTYYSSLSCGTIGGTAASVGALSMNTPLLTQFFGATMPTIEMFATNSAHPLPSTLTVSSANNLGYALALRSS